MTAGMAVECPEAVVSMCNKVRVKPGTYSITSSARARSIGWDVEAERYHSRSVREWGELAASGNVVLSNGPEMDLR